MLLTQQVGLCDLVLLVGWFTKVGLHTSREKMGLKHSGLLALATDKLLYAVIKNFVWPLSQYEFGTFWFWVGVCLLKRVLCVLLVTSRV